MMAQISGRCASPGITSGSAFIYSEPELLFETCRIEDADSEKNKLGEAFKRSADELELIKNSLTGDLGEEYGHIFRAQITMIEDDEFIAEISGVIDSDRICAEAALKQIYEGYAALFSELGEDDYNRQRLLDLTDVYKRILRNLLGIASRDLSGVPAGTIVIAEDLMPSDTATMNRENINAILTEKGGVTSHVAILAKSLGIPAAVGVSGLIEAASQGAEILLDSRDLDTAHIWITPEPEEKERFSAELRAYKQKREELEKLKGLEAVTVDGKKIELSANIGSITDLESAVAYGAKSIGLLRTEFFFLRNSRLPDEEEQFLFYKKVAETVSPGMVIIRTLDIGGDKEVKCFELPQEDNPFLGLRGIRVSLRYKNIFKTQLRAILRASVFGNIKIMFPMVSDLTELRMAKDLIQECRKELEGEKLDFNAELEIGVMVETPAAVMIADILTGECDFISMGTNDLTQYILCSDRINENVSDYYRMFSPALFRALKSAADSAHSNGRWAGICGELGGIPSAIPVLIGLGIDELSMSGQMLPEAVSVIRSLSYEKCRKFAGDILSLKTEEEIKDYLQQKPTIQE